MSDFLAHADRLRQHLRDASELNRAAGAKLRAAETALEDLVQEAMNDPSHSALRCDVPVTDHRRHHRMGRPAKLDQDPELQAFVRARLDRLTFHQIEAEVAQAFPEDRRVRKSAIHAWWKRQSRRK